VRKWTVGLLSLTLASGTGVLLSPSAAVAAPKTGAVASVEKPAVSDDLPNPLEEKRRSDRAAALKKVINGEATVEKRGASTVVKLGSKPAAGAFSAQKVKPDKYVELSREKTDKIFVVLAEFGNQRHPDFPDKDTDPNTPGPAVFDGPQRGQIPAPDRGKDNSTVWQPNYDRQHYQDLYFGKKPGTESVRTYYERQSSGRYSVDGMVTDWVKVPYNEARYGRSGGYPCADHICSNT